jgi:peptidoglycan/LPS O-acetylase OafA/YrhL
MRLPYRPELDGLRGIAVAAVILYHAHVPGFSGGYLGVDVFFVISGYLITQLLETSADRYGPGLLAEFYLRRARRLLPALYTVLIASSLVAAVLFFPDDLTRFGRGLLLAVAFLGNVGAWLDGGYFDPGWRFTPLRHLWSIGVEEQFYLLFPVFLFALARVSQQSRRLVVAALTVLSLALSFWAARRWPVQNYYMLPTRGWELLIGVLIALTPQLSRWSERKRQVLSMLGLAALAGTVWLVRYEWFPGIQTVVACGSTAILVATNSHSLTRAGRWLSWRPLVFTGLISYSLYLWHAPILAFYSYYNLEDPRWPELLLIVPAIYGVSVLSWAAIEKPFRSKPLPRVRSLLLRAGLPVCVAIAVGGYALMRSQGLPQRFGPPQPRAAAVEEPGAATVDARCGNLSSEEVSAGRLCVLGPSDDTAPKVVVWGDSHAAALLPAYRALADSHGLRIYLGLKGACWPLVGAEAGVAGSYWHARCVEFNQAMVRGLRQLRPQRVILNAYWLDPDAPAIPDLLQRWGLGGDAVLSGIERTLDAVRAAGASTCAVLTVPGYPYPVPYALAMAQRRHLDAEVVSISRAEALAEYRVVESDLRLLARQNRLRVVDTKDALCPAGRCRVVAPDGTLLYQDANHLSAAGSRFVAPLLESCVADLEQRHARR